MDDSGLKTRRALSFGARAAQYAEHRPGYPAEAVRWALEPVRDREQVRVLDLAAGTGRLSEALLEEPVAVIAVEPDDAMRTQLLSRLSGLAALKGTAEDIPLPDERVDAVLVGQAFHWFDPELALPEIARVLKPGGVLAALWNHDDDRVPWVAGLADITGTGVRYSERKHDRADLLPENDLFTAFGQRTFDHVQRRTAATLTETIATHSVTLVKDEPERAETLARVRAYLDETPETATGEFDLPLVTIAARVRKL
ncbi:class I SAM-dependent methyltransferase [Allokutzneria sp. A3M-2-11 16]|uniref:class I SAM-dependent methyltransferase n=1 Tax=Allokutzneria sp. A3M-2-11 16 TaxID=2962043 RepID=UPI0020B69491|nr:class I SAM-dependent methyltransferase [Allokutzneria sp. A3M-2-11 16]MCP3799933.1 class I SAM-dependent methyltransferase [Allokutzneria sp. A3M-2-11 16]